MMREFICILCPNGCRIMVEIEERAEGKAEGARAGIQGWSEEAARILSIEGYTCPRGKTYVEQELISPQRSIATSVLVKNGILPLASVRLTRPIPKSRLFDAMAEIKKCTLTAPVESGTVIIHHLLGYDTDVIVTKDISAGRGCI